MALGIQHNFADLVRAEYALFPAFKEFFFEDEAGEDVYRGLGITLDFGLQQGEFLLRGAGLSQKGVEHDGLVHDRSGFGQGHGSVGLQGRFAGLVGTIVVEGMPEFVRQSHHLVDAAIEVGHYAAFF